MIGVVGLTHLGVVMAAAYAARGVEVLAVDPNQHRIDNLVAHTPDIEEPNLTEYLRSVDRLTFSSSFVRLTECDVVYVTQDVDNHSKITVLPGLRQLIRRAAEFLRPTACMVIVSQVPPGFTRSIKEVPHERLYYQLDNLIFGQALERALQPEQLIVGCAKLPQDPEFFRPHPAFEAQLTRHPLAAPVVFMSYESAELAKMAINCYLAEQVAVTNTLAELAGTFPHADWEDVRKVLRGDQRIGPNAYTKPGLGIGGRHLLRDLLSAVELAALHAINHEVLTACYRHSAHMQDWIVRVLNDAQILDTVQIVAVWGMAYKAGTDSTLDSPSLRFIERRSNPVRVHDPVVRETPPVGSLHRSSTPLETAEGASALVVATPWPEYALQRLISMAKVMVAPRLLLDPFRMFSQQKAEAAGFVYHTIGVGK